MTTLPVKTASPPLTLETPIQYARGVGPVRAELLAAMGIKTCGDLLNYYPRDYLKFAGGVQISELRVGEMVTLQGTLLQTRLIRRRPARFEALLDDASGRCVLTWFNPHGLADKLSPGVQVRVTGKVTQFGGRSQIVQPRYEILDNEDHASAEPRVEAIYAATAELSSSVIARIVHGLLDELVPQVPEWFTPEHLKERNLFARQAALATIHRPQSLPDAHRARRTLAYHEFFLHQTAMAIKRHFQRNGPAAVALRTDEKVDARIRALLDFKLTVAQDRVIEQITKDVRQTKPMNRLLQGDVGSGKTVVALYAMLSAVATGAQAVLMAPTEILAEQHFITLQRYLAHGRVKIALLVGQQSTAERAGVLQGIADGSIGLVVGTHAILSEGVQFKNLALAVIDEQHKFGVSQRAAIRGRHGSPHTLVMTATPIPRTLAMTAFGDLDISVIDELPPGRHPVFTKMTVSENREHVYQFVATRIKEGEQAYVVLPVIDEGMLDLKSATSVCEELQTGWLKDFRVAMIHGRMDRAARQHVMERFRQKLIDVLVSTTVIEVGVDVPNATVMVIEHADRFGLSQLHQLRGRVGRSEKKSHCILVADNNTDDGAARLQAMVKYSSGFKIAEEDLKIRGMGEMIGTRQSGSSDMHFADLLFDTGLLMMARRDAFNTIAADPRLLTPAHAEIRREVLGKFGDSISLADVGDMTKSLSHGRLMLICVQALTAVMFLGGVVLWVRSYHVADNFTLSPPVGWRYQLLTVDGELAFQILFGRPLKPDPIVGHATMTLENGRAFILWMHGKSVIPFAALIPILTTTVGFICVGPSIYNRHRRKQRSLTRQCGGCGYDLRGHKPGEKCPECGTPMGEDAKMKTKEWPS